MIAPRPHDPFDIFDPWTQPVDEPASPRPAGAPLAEAPPRHVPAGPTFEPAGPRLPPPAGRAQPSESPPTSEPDAAQERAGPGSVPPLATPTMPLPPATAAAPAPEAGVHFTATGALEPGMVVSVAAPGSKRARWSEGRPPRTPAAAAPPPDPATQPAEFLRKVVVPQFQGLARRLEASQHYTTVQDLLDLPTPAVRVLIWPRPGLLDQSGARILATFELMLNRSAAARVTSSYWLGARPAHVIPMAEIPVERLGLAWVETQILDFVQKVLDRM